jgi:hypothetical protein
MAVPVVIHSPAGQRLSLWQRLVEFFRDDRTVDVTPRQPIRFECRPGLGADDIVVIYPSGASISFGSIEEATAEIGLMADRTTPEKMALASREHAFRAGELPAVSGKLPNDNPYTDSSRDHRASEMGLNKRAKPNSHAAYA